MKIKPKATVAFSNLNAGRYDSVRKYEWERVNITPDVNKSAVLAKGIL